MPRKYVRKTDNQFDRRNLVAAFNHRIATNCSMNVAAEKFGVKKTTLVDAFGRSKKFSDGVTYVPVKPNINRVFSPKQELHIEYTIQAAKMPKNEVRKMVYQYAKACGSQAIPNAWEKDRMATRDWYYSFVARHQNLSEGHGSKVDPSPMQPEDNLCSADVMVEPCSYWDTGTSSDPATTGLNTSNDPVICASTHITPESVKLFSKAAHRPYRKGQRKVPSCNLTENKEAITDLRMKTEKRKKVSGEKKKSARRRKYVPVEEDSEEVEDDVQMQKSADDDETLFKVEIVEVLIKEEIVEMPIKEEIGNEISIDMCNFENMNDKSPCIVGGSGGASPNITSEGSQDVDVAARPTQSDQVADTPESESMIPSPPLETCQKNRRSARISSRMDSVESAHTELQSASSNQQNINDDSHLMGLMVENELRAMNNQQRVVAKKLISDVLFYGNLDRLCSTSCVVCEWHDSKCHHLSNR